MDRKIKPTAAEMKGIRRSKKTGYLRTPRHVRSEVEKREEN